MRIIHLSTIRTVIVDIIVWFILHMSIAWGVTMIPVSFFDENKRLFRIRKWERSGMVYEQWFGIEQWKRFIPDGASWFRNGFAKKGLRKNDTAYLHRFVKETCRGEFTHWAVITVSPIFFLFNPWYVGIFMIFYALGANGPCIIIQRYNRPRIQKILERKRTREAK